MKIIIVRIDLDVYDRDQLKSLILDRVITIGEATEARCVCQMNDLERLMWVRSVKDAMKSEIKRAS